ncbi:hypothetical protein [Gordonia westfalica]|uniref:Uncharacterized protein n=1 Tax=Gordonia westfalica TaxID=158898 RepID=A0A1H2DNZ4_9ACTN|nr:hypothetical protein [Gordonia westfalica]SDT84078.1 hypothetical protein SAMN04488548_10611 [Gordonia westfalica]SDT84135.1 hypothetical protein SAMN04488548_10629 [Gordonia westfalica]
MKRAIALAAAALFTTTLGAGVADAAPRDITPTIAFPGEHVRYFFSSDTHATTSPTTRPADVSSSPKMWCSSPH